MAKRVIIVHGWDGGPDKDFLPWLKNELESKDFEVIVPEMPNPEEPKIEPWVGKLKGVVGEIGEDDYFIGHSIGCQTIMRYLEGLSEGEKIGGCIFVAGFVHLIGNYGEEDMKIAAPWLETKLDFDKVKLRADNFVAIFSDDDPDVPLSDSEIFKKELGAKIIIEHKKGHFSDDAGVTELPVVLEELERTSKGA